MNNLAFIFPGQGSQKVGMLAQAAAEFPVVEETFRQASTVLGYDLWALAQSGPQQDLNLTERTQPMLLTASVALWRVWLQKTQVMPALMAGHSLGEWSALVCAGVVGFEDAVRLVQLRGKYMQAAVPEGVGSMAAIIGLNDAAIIECCALAAENEVVTAVNFNSPGQVVIAGNVAAVDRACVLCKSKGAKRAQLLMVSAPFHSSLLKPAADKLAEDIKAINFNSPAIPVIHNVHALAESEPARIKELMIEQIYHPVRWVDCMGALVDAGVDIAVECGPGKVLSGLTKRINRELTSLAIEHPENLVQAVSLLSK